MLIRVLEIPSPTGNFHFSGGEPQTFVEVDWFRDENHPDHEPDFEMMTIQEGQTAIEEMIRGKKYFSSDKAYLVLAQENSFTIGYSAP